MTNIYFTCLDDYRDIEIFNTYHQFVDSGMVTRDDMMRYFALLGRDNGRTPMQWNTSSNAENEMADPDSVFSYYKKLISLHHTETTLVYGDFIPMLENSDDIYAYKRVLGDVSFP